VARIVCDETRLLDVPARLGGDEFSILLPNENAEMARMVAERIRARIADTPIMNGTQPVKVTVSIGVASYPEHNAKSPSDLVALADRALYQSKLEPERNRVAVFQPTS
jgi:diguanylate cyclase (GGDEF)-like protein